MPAHSVLKYIPAKMSDTAITIAMIASTVTTRAYWHQYGRNTSLVLVSHACNARTRHQRTRDHNKTLPAEQ
jgi:hypothetical protein